MKFGRHFNTFRWRHNDHDGVSNHQPHGCLLNRLFRRRLKKTSKLRVTGLCVGNSSRPVNSPHKGPVTRKMFPFDDVIMSVFTLYCDPINLHILSYSYCVLCKQCNPIYLKSIHITLYINIWFQYERYIHKCILDLNIDVSRTTYGLLCWLTDYLYKDILLSLRQNNK